MLNSKPCINCYDMLKRSSIIKRVYYSNTEGNITCELLTNMNNCYESYGNRMMRKNGL